MSALFPLLFLVVLVVAAAAVVAAVWGGRASARRQVTGAGADRRPREVVLATQPLISKDGVLLAADVAMTITFRVDSIIGWKDGDERVVEAVAVAALRCAAEEETAEELMARHHLLAERVQRLLRMAPTGHQVRSTLRLERGATERIVGGSPVVRVVPD